MGSGLVVAKISPSVPLLRNEGKTKKKFATKAAAHPYGVSQSHPLDWQTETSMK